MSPAGVWRREHSPAPTAAPGPSLSRGSHDRGDTTVPKAGPGKVAVTHFGIPPVLIPSSLALLNYIIENTGLFLLSCTSGFFEQE